MTQEGSPVEPSRTCAHRTALWRHLELDLPNLEELSKTRESPDWEEVEIALLESEAHISSKRYAMKGTPTAMRRPASKAWHGSARNSPDDRYFAPTPRIATDRRVNHAWPATSRSARAWAEYLAKKKSMPNGGGSRKRERERVNNDQLMARRNIAL
ncbi:hypothetical protein IE81DRAFT_331420 [Ceraceosorus guamensis]|uniref:Uncharacterized protein n=1 Tax=Ceraceosorus guamensis TaxID=1522189 RepID=A0A316VU45_9BASI|nr:hypothetical protein IE81DRAFT_331420 [Ceraceosorus guamensis]PWN40744.1 hypothetical protein IE81DRAFT_331420 [Ceraceosorus guamensis]